MRTSTRGRLLLDPGTRIGDWVVEAPIGEGAMGSVYRCRSTLSARIRAAVKVVKAHQLGAHRDRFIREVELLASLRNDAVVRVLGFGEDAAHQGLFLAMELLDGADLASHLESGPLPVAAACRALAPVADGLASAHAVGIFHRDVKPANIFLCSDGAAKLIDFGIAVDINQTRLTATDVVPGTLDYLPPEVFEEGVADPGAWDLYAFGLVLYETLTGLRAFPNTGGGSPQAQQARIVRMKMEQRVFDLGVGFPTVLRSLVGRATEPDPRQRQVGLREMARVLMRVAADADAAPPRLERPAPEDTRGLIAAALAQAAPVGEVAAGGQAAASPLEGARASRGAAAPVQSTPTSPPPMATAAPSGGRKAARPGREAGILYALAGAAAVFLVFVVVASSLAAWWLGLPSDESPSAAASLGGVPADEPAPPSSPEGIPGVAPDTTPGPEAVPPPTSPAPGVASPPAKAASRPEAEEPARTGTLPAPTEKAEAPVRSSASAGQTEKAAARSAPVQEAPQTAADVWGAPPEATSGTLRILTDPSGATVSIDGAQRGQGTVVTDLPYGTHTVKVALAGYKSETREVSLQVREMTVPFSLKAEVMTGTINVYGPAGYKLVVDGHNLGSMPVSVQVAEGVRQFKLMDTQGSGCTLSRDVRFKSPGRPETVTLSCP